MKIMGDMKEPNEEKTMEDRFRERFVPSSLKWKDAVHCTCCSTEEEYEEILAFIHSENQRLLEKIEHKIARLHVTTFQDHGQTFKANEVMGILEQAKNLSAKK